MYWIPIVYLVLIVVGVGVTLYFLSRRFHVRRRIECPVKKETVVAEFTCTGSLDHPHPVDVRSCTSFPNPKKVDCEKDCMTTADLSLGHKATKQKVSEPQSSAKHEAAARREIATEPEATRPA